MEQNNDTAPKIGKLFFGWAIVLLIGMWGAQSYLDERNSPNSSPNSNINAVGQQEVVLQRNAYGHYVVDGEINGQRVTFMLDTGATSVSIPYQLASRLGLEEGYPYDVSTANGVIKVFSTKINQIGIGDIRLNNIHGSLNPFQTEEDEILLGMSFLRHLEMVQKGDQLILRY